jgi:hypothetical protein
MERIRAMNVPKGINKIDFFNMYLSFLFKDRTKEPQSSRRASNDLPAYASLLRYFCESYSSAEQPSNILFE